MSDTAEHVATEQCFAIEFEDKGASRFMSLRNWKGQEICRVVLSRSGLPSTELTGELGSLDRLLSVVSTKADTVACSGCSAALVFFIDEIPASTRTVQSCFRFSQLDLPS